VNPELSGIEFDLFHDISIYIRLFIIIPTFLSTSTSIPPISTNHNPVHRRYIAGNQWYKSASIFVEPECIFFQLLMRLPEADPVYLPICPIRIVNFRFIVRYTTQTGYMPIPSEDRFPPIFFLIFAAEKNFFQDAPIILTGIRVIQASKIMIANMEACG
jgi:hypothetical protein